MERKEIELIKSWAGEFCQENALYLVRVEQFGGKITVYADGDENITIAQCGQLSRYIQNQLDELSDILSEYAFDVSSPGMSNPLLQPFQYRKRIGKYLDFILEDGREVNGKVIEVDDEQVKFEVTIPKNKKLKQEEKIETYHIPYSQIKKATIPLPLNFKKK